MGKVNIKFQMKCAVDACFKPGSDHHSERIQNRKDGKRNEEKWKIYSWSARNNMKDFSANLANYLKDNYPEIRKVRDIKTEHVQNFLQAKADQGCSAETMTTYKSNWNKLERILNKHYRSVKLQISKELVKPDLRSKDKLRQGEIETDHLKQVLAITKNSKCASAKGIRIACRFGFRVSEVVKIQKRDIIIDEKKMEFVIPETIPKLKAVDSKGKHTRTITITKGDLAYFKAITKDLKPNDRLVPVRKDSVNKYLGRQFEKLGIDKYKSQRTGIHAIRKNAAQRRYDEYRKTHTEEETIKYINVFLGHGEERNRTLVDTYVGKVW